MKRIGIAAAMALVPVIILGAAISSAQAFDPLALGALGTAMGFAVGGSARDAAIGGAAGVAAGMLLNAPRYYGPAYYDPPPPRYRAPCAWVPGHYSYSGYWVSGHCRSRVWIPGHYNRYGDYVPGHWSYR